MSYLSNKRRSMRPPFLSLFYTKQDKVQKFKQLNQYEYLGLIKILEEAFPWIDHRTNGTSANNIINIFKTITENCPDDDYCMLGAFGLTKDYDIVLEFYDYETESKSKLYYITFKDARDYDDSSLQPFNCFLNSLN